LTPNSESSDGDGDVIPDDVNLLTVPYLPVRRVLADGTAIIVRSLRDREEIKSFYAATKAAATSGKGYGVDELPNIGFFVQWYVNDYYNIVFELALPTSSSPSREHANGTNATPPATSGSGGRIIAYANIGKSFFSRSVNNSKISDSNIVILPEFRGRHWSEQLLVIRAGISYDMGFTVAMGDTVINNMPIVVNGSRIGVVMVGTIPRGVYIKNVGWIDTVVGYLATNGSFEKKLPRRTKIPPWQVESKI